MNGSNFKVNQIEALERRIDEIESRNAMRDLVSNYCHGFDRRDWDCFIGIWHEDAVWDIGPPTALPSRKLHSWPFLKNPK